MSNLLQISLISQTDLFRLYQIWSQHSIRIHITHKAASLKRKPVNIYFPSKVYQSWLALRSVGDVFQFNLYITEWLHQKGFNTLNMTGI